MKNVLANIGLFMLTYKPSWFDSWGHFARFMSVIVGLVAGGSAAYFQPPWLLTLLSYFVAACGIACLVFIAWGITKDSSVTSRDDEANVIEEA